MDLKKFGRGDFWGIIIPGMFLCSNLLFLLNKQIKATFGIDLLPNLFNQKVALFSLFFIFSYIIGFCLRLIKPDYMEILSSVLWSIQKSLLLPYQYIFIKADRRQVIFLNYKKLIKSFYEKFPYIDSFWNVYLRSAPNSISIFYDGFLAEEYNNDKNRMKNMYFINHCRLFIYNKSTLYYNEILFHEGFIRFLSGMSWALVICIITGLFILKYRSIILLYSFFLCIIVMKLKTIRRQEIYNILNTFAILKLQEKREEKNIIT